MGHVGRARRRRAIARAPQIAGFILIVMGTFPAVPGAEPAANVRMGAGKIEGALILAYRNNPQLNAQRSSIRATDENVPTALAGYRPRVTGTSSLTEQYLDNLTKSRRRNRALFPIPRGDCGVVIRIDG
jgi:outer membrane protein TolC